LGRASARPPPRVRLAAAAPRRRCGVEDAEKLFARLPNPRQPEARAVGQTGKTNPVGRRRRGAAAEEKRAQGQIEAVRKPEPEEEIVQPAASFAQQPADPEAPPEPGQSGRQAGRTLRRHEDRSRPPLELPEPPLRRPGRGQEKKGRAAGGEQAQIRRQIRFG